MLTCLSRILVFCWCNHLWWSGQLFVHFLMSVSWYRWWDHKPMLSISGLVIGSWGSWFLLFHFDQLPICPFKIVCLQQEKWISGGKTFDILCLFCQSYLICAWKGWLYVSLWKLLFVFLYHWHFGGLWTTFLQIIMSKFNVIWTFIFYFTKHVHKHIRATRPTGPVHDPRMKRILF